MKRTVGKKALRRIHPPRGSIQPLTSSKIVGIPTRPYPLRQPLQDVKTSSFKEARKSPMPVATHRNRHGRDMIGIRRSTARRPAFGMTHDPTLRTNQSEHDEAQHHAANQNADTHLQSDAARIMQVGRVGCGHGNRHTMPRNQQPLGIDAIRRASHQGQTILPRLDCET